MEFTTVSTRHEYQVWVDAAGTAPKKMGKPVDTREEAESIIATLREGGRTWGVSYWGVQHTEVTEATDDIEWLE